MNKLQAVRLARWLEQKRALILPLGVRAIACLIFSWGHVSPLCFAQSLDSLTSDVRTKLDTYLSRASSFGFSGVVLVVKHGTVVFQNGYGLADRIKGIAFTPETAVDIGSVTKQFTASAVLKLEMEGRLSTSDRIGKYLNGVPTDKAEMTIHELLTHTSGLARDYGNKNAVVSRDRMIAGVLSTPLVSKPGEKYSYSNAGYVLLAAIIEIASGQSFYSFMHQSLFDPLGMSKTGFYNESGRWASDEIAHSYFETAEEGIPTAWPLTWSATGNGHVITTMADLFRWELSLRDSSVLSGQQIRKLFNPLTRVDEATSYGYGWFIKKRSTGDLFFHAGFYRSFGTEYRRYPEDDVAIIVATNQGYLEGRGMQVPITEPVAAIALGKQVQDLPPVISIPADSLRRFEGNYRLISGGHFSIYLAGNSLSIETTGQDAFNAIYCDSSKGNDVIIFNRQTSLMVSATQKGDRSILEKVLSKSDFASYMANVDSGWSSLAKQFGNLKSFDILGTAPYPFTEEYVRTYARLNFEHEDVIVTFGYRNGAFFDFSTWETVQNPGALPLAPISRDELVTYCLWTGRLTRFQFDTSADGRVLDLRVLSSAGQITARRMN